MFSMTKKMMQKILDGLPKTPGFFHAMDGSVRARFDGMRISQLPTGMVQVELTIDGQSIFELKQDVDFIAGDVLQIGGIEGSVGVGLSTI